MNKILPLTFLLVLLAITASASAYNLTYVNKDTSGNVYIPSVFTANQCTVNMYLRDTASATESFTISDHFYSPDYIERAYSILTFENDITCRPVNSDPILSTTSSNSFYEATTNSTNTSDTFNSWLTTIYDCDFDANELFIYSNTGGTDNYGNHPFGYIRRTATQCDNAGICAINPLTSDLNPVIDYIDKGYYTLCGSELTVDRQVYNSFVCTSAGNPTTWGRNDWTMTPLNSAASGSVNISVTVRDYSYSGTCIGPQLTYQLYLWDTVTNTSTNLGTTVPYSGILTLIPNREYWLLIGSRICGSKVDIQTCAVSYINSTYNISIWAYEPAWECGEWSDCLDGIETRLCIDPLEKVPNRLEQQTCFDVPTVDIELGFEEYYDQDIWICQKDYWLVTCTERLESISAKYPVNWTVIGSDVAGKNLENFVTISQDWASKGSSSIKMWYYPPKNEEPVAPTPVCGNATTGRFAQITSDYNESLFISTNVSFASPYFQLRFDVKKCNLPVIQYDYGVWFACGKKCYSNNCSVEPDGRFGIRITELDGGLIITHPSFSFYDDVGNNETANVTDNNIYTYSQFDSAGGATINSTENIFYNGTILNFTLNVTGGVIPICIYDNLTNEIYRFTVPTADDLYNFTIVLANISFPINEINLVQCNPPARNVRMRLFEIINEELTQTSNGIVFDYYDEATISPQNKIIDFSNLNLQTGINYTISIAVNPENVFDPNAHCIYMDDFSITFTDVALPECESYCDGLTFYSAIQLEGGACKFTITPVSPNCITDLNIKTAIETNENFEYEEKLYIYNNETGEWELIDIPEPTPEEQEQLSLYDPPEFVQAILLGFGLTQTLFGYVWFFFSLFMLMNYIAFGISIGITVYLKTQLLTPVTPQGQDNSYIPFLSVFIVIIVGALFSGFYPLEIGIPVIVFIGLLLWKQVETIVGGHR